LPRFRENELYGFKRMMYQYLGTAYRKSPKHSEAKMKDRNDIAKKFFGTSYESLDDVHKKIAEHVSGQKYIAKNTAKKIDVSGY